MIHGGGNARALVEIQLTTEPIEGDIDVLAIGKASVGMAAGVAAKKAAEIRRGLIITNDGGAGAPANFSLRVADHPIPGVRSLAAANAALAFVSDGDASPHLVVLLSGGASAMLTLPNAGLELEHVTSIAGALMSRGATIEEINEVRRGTEQLKGGGLGRAATADRITVLVISDVVGDRLDIIGSGPFYPHAHDGSSAADVLKKYDLASQHPQVASHLRYRPTAHEAQFSKLLRGEHERVRHVVIASHVSVAHISAMTVRDMGWQSTSVWTDMTGSSGEWAERLIDCASRPVASPTCYILAGEPTVDVSGRSGRGGPSQEVAARWLVSMAETPAPGPRALMTFSTDGIDGPTPNAGGVVLTEHIAAARSRLPWLRERLADHDSATALEALGAALQAGQTGTNVNHIAVLLALPADANSRPPEYHTANV